MVAKSLVGCIWRNQLQNPLTFPFALLYDAAMKPWTIVPAFKEARLVKLAKILVRIRNQAAALQQPQ